MPQTGPGAVKCPAECSTEKEILAIVTVSQAAAVVADRAVLWVRDFFFSVKDRT